MGHTTAAALSATHLVGVAATAGGVVMLYFRKRVTDAIRVLSGR